MSDHKALLKHSSNYFFATLATKALAFVSIPVYTRLLTVEEYGVVGVFMSVVGIAQVLFTLDSEVAISRYYYDAESIDDFKRFVGTTLSLTLIILCCTSMIFILITPFLADSLSFPVKLTFCLLPVALYNLTNSIFTQIYNPLLQSKKIAVVSSIQAYLAFGLSVLCMFFLPVEKYYGYVYGNIIAMILLGTYLFHQIRFYCILSFKKSHIRYILNYCIPYMPYTLSGVILLQFSRIFLGNNQGYNLAGSYTLTTNIATLMMIVVTITHNAWNPYYFRYMNAKDTTSLDSDYNLIWRTTLLIAFGLSAFGYELALALSKGGDYLKTMYVLPLLVLGYVIFQWSYVYLRNTGYAKRNIWNAYCVLISGVSNILFNAYFVSRYGEIGAAVATLSSYFILLILSYITNRFIIRGYVPHLGLFVKPFLVLVPFLIAISIIYVYHFSFVSSFILKLLLFVILSFIYFCAYKDKLKVLIKRVES